MQACLDGAEAPTTNLEYATILRVAGRLPELVLQEDPDLLMYYDNATLRVE